jgi:putative spermidine/putrescine transport system ATP-binding protein
MTHLALAALSKHYGSAVAVDHVDLDLARGKFLALLGPSGCGKTTTLRMIAGLVEPSSGKILVDGADITRTPPYRRDMGLVFQSYALFPHMDVARNVGFGLRMRGIDGADATSRVAEALALVRLTGLEARRPKQLSGGQQQRVALARALVIRPTLLLLDEPLSNLDAKLREEMRAEISDIQKTLGITTVFVTHDQSEALAMADLVAVMDSGRVAQLGTPTEIFEKPATPFVAGFVGRVNVLQGEADGSEVAVGPHRLRAASEARGPVSVMVRPHRMRLSERPGATNRISGTIRRLTYVGEVLEIEIDASGHTLRVERSTDEDFSALAPGADITAHFAPEHTLVFPRTP